MIALVAFALAEDGGSVRHHVAQARQFVKNHWYEDAALEIQAGLALPGGADNFDLHFLGAQVYYELVDLDVALPLAARAAALAPGNEQVAAYAAFLRENFGWIEVTAPHEGMTSRLQVECTSIVFDADLKRIINKVALQVHERTSLPARIALPVGDYLVNGVAVSVVGGQTAPLPLPMDRLGARGLAALQVTRLEIAAGMGVLFGDRVENLHPGAVAELSLTQPIGPLLVGLLVDYDVRGYSAGLGQEARSPWSGGAGLRVGQEFAIGGPLGVRPSLGARYGLVPGVGLDCDQAGATLTCVPLGEGADPAVEIYAIGRAWIPFVELSVEYREAGRTTALGAGVKAVVEQYAGTVPSPGDAALYDGGDVTLPYEAEPATWTATGIRLSANLSIAF